VELTNQKKEGDQSSATVKRAAPAPPEEAQRARKAPRAQRESFATTVSVSEKRSMPDEPHAACDCSTRPFGVGMGIRSLEHAHLVPPYSPSFSRQAPAPPALPFNGSLLMHASLSARRHFSACVRQEIVDWMMSCAGSLRLDREAFQLAVAHLDRYLYIKGPESFLSKSSSGRRTGADAPLPQLPNDDSAQLVTTWSHSDSPIAVRDKLRRLGTTCLFVSGKLVHNPSVCPSAARFASLAPSSSFSRGQMLIAERTLLETLGHKMIVPTSGSFAKAYLSRAESAIGDKEAHENAIRVALTVTDVSHLVYSQVGAKPSIVAAAAVALGTSTALNIGSVESAWKLLALPLSSFTGFTSPEVSWAASPLLQALREVTDMSQLHCSRLPCLKRVCSAHGWSPSEDQKATPQSEPEYEDESLQKKDEECAPDSVGAEGAEVIVDVENEPQQRDGGGGEEEYGDDVGTSDRGDNYYRDAQQSQKEEGQKGDKSDGMRDREKGKEKRRDPACKQRTSSVDWRRGARGALQTLPTNCK